MIPIGKDRPAPISVMLGDSNPRVLQAISAGAAAFAPRSAEVETLLDTCIDVAAGKMVFPFLDVRQLQQDPIHQPSRKGRTILEALCKGLTNRDLASELPISTNTVKFHLSNLYDKLSVRSRAQAIAFYYSSQMPSHARGKQDDSH